MLDSLLKESQTFRPTLGSKHRPFLDRIRATRPMLTTCGHQRLPGRSQYRTSFIQAMARQWHSGLQRDQAAGQFFLANLRFCSISMRCWCCTDYVVDKRTVELRILRSNAILNQDNIVVLKIFCKGKQMDGTLRSSLQMSLGYLRVNPYVIGI